MSWHTASVKAKTVVSSSMLNSLVTITWKENAQLINKSIKPSLFHLAVIFDAVNL